MITVNIPEERKAILIGRGGETKLKLEKRTYTKINVGKEVEIYGDPESELKVSDIIKAIGRGFSPAKALTLLEGDCVFDVISLKGTPNTIKRLMSRVIGSGGKAKKKIEFLTHASIEIYGKTISIIGTHREAENARHAIEMLLSGRTHNFVWRTMERKLKSSGDFV